MIVKPDRSFLSCVRIALMLDFPILCITLLVALWILVQTIVGIDHDLNAAFILIY